MSDAHRVEWLRNKTCQGLGIEVELFDQMLEDGAPAINDFLDGGEHKCLTIVFNAV